MLESWKERAEKLEREVYTLYLAYRDPRCPLAAKAVIVLVVAYAASPIDAIPDFIPGLGYLDDLLLLPLGVALALRLVPEDLLAECRTQAEGDLEDGTVRWVGLAITVFIWALIAAVLFYVFW